MKSFISLAVMIVIGAVIGATFNTTKTQAETVDVPAFVTYTPTPTESPYKQNLKQSLSEVQNEINTYQGDLLLYQKKYNDLKDSEPSTANTPAQLILALYQDKINTLNSYTYRENNDATKLDQLRQEKNQLEFQLAQLDK